MRKRRSPCIQEAVTNKPYKAGEEELVEVLERKIEKEDK